MYVWAHVWGFACVLPQILAFWQFTIIPVYQNRGQTRCKSRAVWSGSTLTSCSLLLFSVLNLYRIGSRRWSANTGRHRFGIWYVNHIPNLDIYKQTEVKLIYIEVASTYMLGSGIEILEMPWNILFHTVVAYSNRPLWEFSKIPHWILLSWRFPLRT